MGSEELSTDDEDAQERAAVSRRITYKTTTSSFHSIVVHSVSYVTISYLIVVNMHSKNAGSITEQLPVVL